MIDQHVTSLEQIARQPRLAMEADGQANTKTRERTEGATTALQTMHGDSCTAQKVQDGPKASSSFGVKAEPPALPCRDDVLVEDGAAAPKSCLPSLEMRSPSAAGGLLPAGKTSTATEATSKEPLLRFYATEETIQRREYYGLQFHPPLTTAASGNCLLPPTAGESLRQNPGKIGRLIKAVCKVILAPARFWDRGARWFMVRLCMLDQLVTSCSIFPEEIRWLHEARSALCCARKKLAVEGGSRLHEPEGRTEVTPSWRLDVIGS